jgi:phage gp29-like protein
MPDINPALTTEAGLVPAAPNPAPKLTPEMRAETIRRMILQKIPSIGLVPANLLEGLNQYDRGWFATLAKLFDSLKERHHVVKSVTSKREKRLARMRWDILVDADAAVGREAEAKKHQEALQGFYRCLTATSLLESDIRGGVGLMLRQMAHAIGNRFAVHEITWKPADGNRPFTAEFREWPIWSFEGRTGVLRWMPQPALGNGYDMPENQWLVTSGDGLMRATVGLVAIQQMSLNDWANYAEKFGLPFVLGKTGATKGTQQWDDMKAMVKAFVGDGAGVINVDAAVELITAGGSGEMPHAALVEYCDRWITALWLGADLATMSAGQGQGQGASLQQREIEALEQDDAREMSEVLNTRIDRQVIAYLFGEGVEPLAKIQIIPPQTVDTDAEIKTDTFLLQQGVALSEDEVRERYNRSAPTAGAKVITGRPATTQPQGGNYDPNQKGQASPTASASNEAPSADFSAEAVDNVAMAFADFFAPLRERLQQIAELPEEQMLNALESVGNELGDYLSRRGVDPKAVKIIDAVMGQMVLLGLTTKPTAAATATTSTGNE